MLSAKAEKFTDAHLGIEAILATLWLGGPKISNPAKPKKLQYKESFPQKDPTKVKDVLYGQKGPALDLKYERLNKKELAILAAFTSFGVSETYSITSLALKCFPDENVKVANSWVRNCLRRLVRSAWLVNVYPGHFRVPSFRIHELSLPTHKAKTA